MVKRLALLGSTGSIGKGVLRVAEHLGESLDVVALAAHSDIDTLESQARQFKPRLVAVAEPSRALELQSRLPCRVVGGEEGIIEAATISESDMVVAAIDGAAALKPTVAAIKAGKTIALASKEVLVSGGSVVMSLAKRHGTPIIPIDSEHCAVFQCLHGEEPATLKRILLTSSGGPFWKSSPAELACVTPQMALSHPNYRMGAKVTVDSSTLMNKGLEVIEAYWLYGVLPGQIEVVVHPEQLVHSMVEFVDGSMIAQVSEPDMIGPIQYALTYPERLPSLMQPLDFGKPFSFQFFPPDPDRFRCLQLAYTALKEGGSMPCAMNAANEVLVRRFLGGEIAWVDISRKLQGVMERHQCVQDPSMEVLLSVDQEMRAAAREV